MAKIDLFLDSGAFSAYAMKKEINITDYINFIKENEKHITVYANMDVIGDPEKTLENQKIMEAEGLSPLPCFHQGEDTKYLEHYVENYEYICVGGMASKRFNYNTTIANLDTYFTLVCSSSGIPKVKVHGFGITAIPMVLRYPWYSVDSSTWVVFARYGKIIVPRRKNNVWVYDTTTNAYTVSFQNLNSENHIYSLSPILQKDILDYIEEKGYCIGESKLVTVKDGYVLKENEVWANKKENLVEKVIIRGLGNDYKLRDELNILYFLDLQASIPEWPTVFEHMKRRGFGL